MEITQEAIDKYGEDNCEIISRIADSYGFHERDNCPMIGCKGSLERTSFIPFDSEENMFRDPVWVLQCNRKRCNFAVKDIWTQEKEKKEQ
jgi:hypothetical protein